MLIDTHMHTRFSADSQMTANEAIEKARELGIGITFTEHWDLDYPSSQVFTFDVDAYFREYGQLRDKDQVLLGVEIGMRCDLTDENRQVVGQHPFDFVLGSVHVIEKMDVYMEALYQNRSKQDVYDVYFNYIIDCLGSYEFVDSLGHIDYICRYARYADPEIYYHQFQESIDQILALLASKGKAIEINTRRFDRKEIIDILKPIYKRFKELGGKIATVGSDAHNPGDVGKCLQEGVDFALECGLRPVYFQERQPNYLNW